MNFLLDENFPKAVIPVLEGLGHVVFDFREIGKVGVPDSDVVLIAFEKSAAILTTDRDFFHTLGKNHPNHHGILVVALKQPTRDAIIDRLMSLLEHVDIESIPGRAFQLRDRTWMVYPPIDDVKKIPDLIVLMGVSGCGKSTLGRVLESEWGWHFLEGDDFHPPGNIEKMGAGIPLTDVDRWPWYDALRDAAKAAIAERTDDLPVVLACSALKRAYRDRMLEGIGNARLVFLRGSREVIWGHVTNREHEYMQPSLLDSQFETLEVPGVDEDAVVLEIADGMEAALVKLEGAFLK